MKQQNPVCSVLDQMRQFIWTLMAKPDLDKTTQYALCEVFLAIEKAEAKIARNDGKCGA